MDLESFIEDIKEMQKTARKNHDEITFWRERYLDSIPGFSSRDKAAYIWKSFLFADFSEFKDKELIDVINYFQKHYEELYENKSS